MAFLSGVCLSRGCQQLQRWSAAAFVIECGTPGARKAGQCFVGLLLQKPGVIWNSFTTSGWGSRSFDSHCEGGTVLQWAPRLQCDVRYLSSFAVFLFLFNIARCSSICSVLGDTGAGSWHTPQVERVAYPQSLEVNTASYRNVVGWQFEGRARCMSVHAG